MDDEAKIAAAATRQSQERHQPVGDRDMLPALVRLPAVLKRAIVSNILLEVDPPAGEIYLGSSQ
jgi:hypothetical protein